MIPIIARCPDTLSNNTEGHEEVGVHARRHGQSIQHPPCFMPTLQGIAEEKGTEEGKKHQLRVHACFLAVPDVQWRERQHQNCPYCCGWGCQPSRQEITQW